ncbi:CBS domain-containing protein [Streptomyces sp. NBC_00190]|uniref:CBS domain-containing protein n=1 Tax=unclassified Streptomyces TaxID=2593676 RepID=UPI002E27FE03|nr:CBS domain-containing protein [Streptomyces sp. NBC_00190]WSZ38705.1 CBS domain-containing protein [Streptomyces sp. NBC_00868]
MKHRTVAELMTPNAVGIRRETTFKEIARLLKEFDITAVPVVDEAGRPVGVVSEADLLHRHGSGTGATTAAALMTSPAITAEPGWSAVRAGRAMRKHGVKRLPVIDAEGRLIGILSRSDLLQVFLRRDHAIQEEILEDVVTQTLGIRPSTLTVDVTEGVVTLSGAVGRRSLIPVLVQLCQSVEGVVDVIDRLVCEHESEGDAHDDEPGDRRP